MTIIIGATLDFADQETRDRVVAESAATQQATRDEEPGCDVYCFAADPCVPTRIQVYELWQDEASLVAHFVHPNYAAMRDLIRSYGPTGAWNRAYQVTREEPVYGEGGAAKTSFFADGANVGKLVGAIDIHAHAVLEAAFGQAGRYGPELATDDQGVPYFRIGEYSMKPMNYRSTLFMDVDQRLERMDADGIDLQLLSPNPLTMLHGVEAEDAIRFCRVHNDAMAALVAEHPQRFLGGIALPMQDVDAAMAELQRAVSELGLCAPYVGTDFGYELDDARLEDFYRTLVELDVPLFLHPASTDGVGLPPPRMRRFELSLLLGYAYDETLAVAALVLGGVTERHPQVDVCVSHGGGVAAFFAEKFQMACDTRRWVPEHLRDGGFLAHLRRLWFDSHMDAQPALDLLVDTVDPERIVFGTNYGGWDSGGGHARDDFTLTLTANARRLLRLPEEA